MKQKAMELVETERRAKIWSSSERKLWLTSLFLGTAALYSTRTVMPLCIVSLSKEMNWDKMQSGAVLSAFFWGYASTQFLGGYLSDRLSGDIVLLTGAVGWGLVTFWTPPFVYMFGNGSWTLFFVMFTRVLAGCFQGVHFPALASYLSSRVSDDQRTASFSISSSGCHVGTLLSGSVGSLLLEYFGWTCPFYAFGIASMLWVIGTRYYLVSHDRRKAILSMQGNISSAPTSAPSTSPIPWLVLFKSLAFWSLMIGHFCNTAAYFMLLSWLPTYFQENFTGAKGWVFNVVPWLVTLPSSIASGIIADRLIANGWNTTVVRKLMETVALGGLGTCLALVTFCKSYETTLFVFALALFVNGFHNAGILTNPQDIAPRHAGSVFGLMNTAGSIPGFVGVYLTGHVLQVTKNWNLIFSSSSFVCFFGWFVFVLFGTAKKIIL